jgi:hypothetical protein
MLSQWVIPADMQLACSQQADRLHRPGTSAHGAPAGFTTHPLRWHGAAGPGNTPSPRPLSGIAANLAPTGRYLSNPVFKRGFSCASVMTLSLAFVLS